MVPDRLKAFEEHMTRLCLSVCCVRLASAGKQPRKTCFFFVCFFSLSHEAKLLILNQTRLPADLWNKAQTARSQLSRLTAIWLAS